MTTCLPSPVETKTHMSMTILPQSRLYPLSPFNEISDNKARPAHTFQMGLIFQPVSPEFK